MGICISLGFNGTDFVEALCQRFAISLPPIKTTWKCENASSSVLHHSEAVAAEASFGLCMWLRRTTSCQKWANLSSLAWILTPALSVTHLLIVFGFFFCCFFNRFQPKWDPNNVGGSSWPVGQSAQWHPLQCKLNLLALLTASSDRVGDPGLAQPSQS